eukprot:scaffold3887_cov269-Prasinococcus_capsulatus_cf.AAC.3
MGALLWLWFAAALGFYGISLYVGHFGGGLYLNALLSACVEFPGTPSPKRALLPLLLTARCFFCGARVRCSRGAARRGAVRRAADGGRQGAGVRADEHPLAGHARAGDRLLPRLRPRLLPHRLRPARRRHGARHGAPTQPHQPP